MIHQFIFASLKPGMSEQDFREHALKIHAPRVAQTPTPDSSAISTISPASPWKPAVHLALGKSL